MKIHQLEIQNFKGFEKEVFNFNPHFTVLIGDNAKGKTTILDALAVATGSFLLGIEKVSSRTIKEEEIRTITISKQAKPQKPVLITANGIVNGINLEWTREVIISKTTEKKATNLKKIATRILSDSRDKEKNLQTFFPILAYYTTSRLAKKQIRIDDQQNQEKEGFVRAYQDAFEAGVSDNLFLSWYKIQNDSIKDTSTIIKKLTEKGEKLDDNAMKDYLLGIALLNAFKQTIIQTADDISEISFEIDTMFFYVKKKNSDIVEKLKYSQLSDGYRNVIGLAADIAYRCIQLNPHLGENAVKNTEGIVLIDEIDLHLHPKWQRRIVGDLKRIFPKIQFVVTTHSPFIVQSLASDELINLERTVDSPTDDFNLNEISTYLMGVNSPYSEKNNALYKKSKLFIEGLDKGLEEMELNEILNSIPNPALRAFLELTKMTKGK